MLRKMFEVNTELTAFSVTGLQTFNDRAFKALIDSLKKNEVLKTLNFGNLTNRQWSHLEQVSKDRDPFLQPELTLIPPEKIVRER